MGVDEFLRVARNITAAMIHVDPIDVFPADDQFERRIRFRDDPHGEFLRCTDQEQRRISEILMTALGPNILELCVIAEEDMRRQLSA